MNTIPLHHTRVAQVHCLMHTHYTHWHATHPPTRFPLWSLVIALTSVGKSSNENKKYDCPLLSFLSFSLLLYLFLLSPPFLLFSLSLLSPVIICFLHSPLFLHIFSNAIDAQCFTCSVLLDFCFIISTNACTAPADSASCLFVSESIDFIRM